MKSTYPTRSITERKPIFRRLSGKTDTELAAIAAALRQILGAAGTESMSHTVACLREKGFRVSTRSGNFEDVVLDAGLGIERIYRGAYVIRTNIVF